MNKGENAMYVLVVYVRATHVEQVKRALFAAGAGSIPPSGLYHSKIIGN